MPPALFAALALAGAVALIPVLARRRAEARRPEPAFVRDPAREARAEARARELLGSVAGGDVLAMYDQLGFVAVEGGEGYGYLVYPQRPIVSFDEASGELLSEYCVRFPDAAEPEAGRWLPDADDVLAKWMGLRGDERRLLGAANMHLPGRQLDPAMVRRDLDRLQGWRARHPVEEPPAQGTPAGAAEELPVQGTGAAEELPVQGAPAGEAEEVAGK